MLEDVHLSQDGAVLYEVRHFKYQTPFPLRGAPSCTLDFKVEILELPASQYGVGRVELVSSKEDDDKTRLDGLLRKMKAMDDLYYTKIEPLEHEEPKFGWFFNSLPAAIQASVSRINDLLLSLGDSV